MNEQQCNKAARRKKTKPAAALFAPELAYAAAESEFSAWLRSNDPDDSPRFTIEKWPGAAIRVECCLCDGFYLACPACEREVDPVTRVPIGGNVRECNACVNEAHPPVRLGNVRLFHDTPAPFVVDAGGKLQAVCRPCVERHAPWLTRQLNSMRYGNYQDSFMTF